VGERILARLADHPWFQVTEVAASDRSAGMALGRLTLQSLSDPVQAPLVLSALPSDAAREVEPRLAAQGHLVVSNASAHRADPAIPLVIPEVNADHLSLIGDRGGIVTNPNCAVAPMALALAPLHRAFGIESVVATTMQAVSGAGKSGPTVLELTDNLFPVIRGEEEKVEREAQKMLGSVVGDAATGEVIQSADFRVSATTTRVPVLHGHTVDLSVRFSRGVTAEEAAEAMAGWAPGPRLPSLPRAPLRLFQEVDRPQPRLDRDLGDGMIVSVGRIRPCPVNHVRFVVMAHNLERGAAGAAVTNAELCAARGLIPGVSARERHD
jgi:aspartate-semialdehyde dehydrogenase